MTMSYNIYIYLADAIYINIYNISYFYSVACRRSAIGSRGHFDVTYLHACILYYSNRYYIHLQLVPSSVGRPTARHAIRTAASPSRIVADPDRAAPATPDKKKLTSRQQHHRRGEHFESPPPHARTPSIRAFTWWRGGPPRWCSSW